MRPNLSEIETMARSAGEILSAGFGQYKNVQYKGEIDLVTEFDHRSEAYLLGEIQGRFPDHRVISEESGVFAGDECCLWYIDPLDGTVNYAHGVPIFTVSIAYAESGRMELGVVYDPIRDECFSAQRGQGAWLNGEPISPSQTGELGHSLLVTGFGYDIRSNPRNNLKEFSHFSLVSQGVRRLGSAALDLCYVAAGRFDGYWELEINPWDIAAGGLVAEQAGAVVTKISGEAEYLESPCSILAANRYIYPDMQAYLKDS